MPYESKADLIKKAEAAQEILRRYREEKIRFYKACGPKHEAFHKSQKTIRVIFGGNRSGKTMAGLIELLFHACFKKHPYTGKPNPEAGHYRIFTTKFQIAEELIIPLLKEWIPKGWFRGGSWETAYDSRYHILHGVGGRMIDILTYDQESSVAESVAIHGAWMDEEAPERMFSGTLTRLISTGGFLVLTVTPLYSMTWAIRLWRTQGTDPTLDVFRISIHDNPHLPKEYVEAIIAQWPEHERKARESGEMMEFQGLVYKELRGDVHRITAEPDSTFPVICAVDPHQRKPTCVTWAAVTPQEDLVFFDELQVRGTAKDVVEAIYAKEAAHKGRTTLRVVDPAANKQVSGFGSEVTTLREFEEAGMSFTLADNNEAGYNVVHEYLQWDESKPLTTLNRPKLYFTDYAPLTWQGMTNLLWDEWKYGTLKDEKERVRDFEKDFPDCVRYTVVMRPRFSQSYKPVRINQPIMPNPSNSVMPELAYCPLTDLNGAPLKRG